MISQIILRNFKRFQNREIEFSKTSQIRFFQNPLTKANIFCKIRIN